MNEADKSLSLGINKALLSILAAFPSPILYGFIIGRNQTITKHVYEIYVHYKAPNTKKKKLDKSHYNNARVLCL